MERQYVLRYEGGRADLVAIPERPIWYSHSIPGESHFTFGIADAMRFPSRESAREFMAFNQGLGNLVVEPLPLELPEKACDFCGDVPATEAFPCGDSAINTSKAVSALAGGIPVRDEMADHQFFGAWFACNTCAGMVSRNERDALVRRAVDQSKVAQKYPLHMVERATRMVHNEFWENRR